MHSESCWIVVKQSPFDVMRRLHCQNGSDLTLQSERSLWEHFSGILDDNRKLLYYAVALSM